ncbi:porin [Arvimicrobium flavum]|uniref:porin n=1 Tax=Arvimicrobium flavum TaxID=3393320 RepID=UPI00237C1DB8|nr:porin [Mesorhizobium shangrilense]
MNFRDLILHAVPAIVLASVAHAADDAALDAEPLSYVRACDVWGAGFYYIPGTETCVKAGGHIRYDIAAGKVPTYGLAVPGTYHSRSELALNWDARTETELGTLRSFAQVTFAFDNALQRATGSPNSASLPFGYMTLGSTTSTGLQFRLGVNDTLFRTAAGLTALHIYAGGFTHAPTTTGQMVVSYGKGNFSGALGLETGAGRQSIDSYMPHVVAAAAYSDSWGALRSAVVYNSVLEEWAAKLKLELNATDDLSLYAMGVYSSDPSGRNFYTPFIGNYGVWVGSTYQFTPKVKGLLQFAADGMGADVDDRFSVLAGLQYEPVSKLYIKPEIAYLDKGSDSEVAGIVRFQTNF